MTSTLVAERAYRIGPLTATGPDLDLAHALATTVGLLLHRYGLPPSVHHVLPDGSLVAAPEVQDPDSYRLGDVLTTATGSTPGSVVVALRSAPGGRVPLRATLVPSPGEDGTEVTALLHEGAPDDLDQVMEHIQVVLRAAAIRPQDRFGDLDVLTERERELLLREWNGPQVRYPDTTLHAMFAEQARRTPDAIAIIDGERSVTYRELDLASNRVARRLRPLLPGAGAPVLCTGPRSIETLTVKIGIMKAGAAFLYVDPSTPSARAQRICEISAPAAVVSSRHAPRPDFQAPTFVLEDLLEDMSVPDAPIDDIADESTAAYILFTSGSTGEPKGVVRPHRMHTTRIFLEQRLYQLDGGDRHLMKSVPFFREFYWALATGGTIVVARPGGERDDAYLDHLIRTHGITVCSFVPSMMRVLLANPRFRVPGLPIRHLFTAGEVVDLDLERQFRDLGIAVHVTYTLAEADYVCHRGEALPDDEKTSTVGRPIDMRLYVCDSAGRLRPPGFVGELYAGGPGLADGYLNRPQLTDDRFVPNPFDPQHAPVLFRTGDLARFRPDGQVEFVGRADAQIKIRGQRVEPTEVEHAIRGHHNVAATAVASLPDADQGNLLVAYVVPMDGVLDVPGLKRFLFDLLPPYMVPTYIVPVADLPLLGSGKLDRAAFATQLRARPDFLAPPEPPEDHVELTVATVWSNVLGLREIGVEDSFLDLGGDSLKVMLLRIALEEALGDRIDLAMLLQTPTVRDFAEQWKSSGGHGER
ncbi:non-ribosomal peptide synthetase [Streptomyces canus]|uniref:non-ribosomal peptide synthetase n=1 Tax=Streptomyces canus TaxID=58343 RepID=UPI000373879B|nr:non-ribosomal peptide synthetase [Streptomyces canus]